MSCDITFILKSEEQTWDKALAANGARALDRRPWNKPVSDATRAWWQPIITALLHAYPDLHRYDAFHTVALSNLATGVKVALYDSEAAIAIPYGLREEEEAPAWRMAVRMAQIIEANSTLQGYDLQSGHRLLSRPPTSPVRRRWWSFWKR